MSTTAVILPPTQSGIYQDDSLEPQFVTIRSCNNGNIVVDSLNRSYPNNTSNAPGAKGLQSPNNFSLGNGNQYFGARYKRIAFSKFSMLYNTPNVNIMNNQVAFYSSSIKYSATVPEGYYTFSTLATALQTALNSAGSSLTFTVTTNSSTNNYTISATGSFYFDPFSTMVRYGNSLIGLSSSTTPSTSSNTSTVYLLYSKSLYICSSAINQYTKNPNYLSGNGCISYLASYDFTDSDYTPGSGIVGPRFMSSDIANPPRWINYDAKQSFTDIDIQLLDDYGRPFYIPDYQNDGSLNSSNIVIRLLTEL